MDISIRSSTDTNRSDHHTTMDLSNESNIGLLASAATAANNYIHTPVEVVDKLNCSDSTSTISHTTSLPLGPNTRVLTPPNQHQYLPAKFSILKEAPVSDPSTMNNQSPVAIKGNPIFSTTNQDTKSSSRAGTPNGNRTSNPEKPFTCDQCDQTFSRQHNLKSHYLTHTQERPYQCKVCDQHFRRHHDLKRHSKLHTGERPYQCSICERSFARLDALNRHLKAEREGGGGCSGVSRGARTRCTSGDKEIGAEKTASPNLPRQIPMPLDSNRNNVAQGGKYSTNSSTNLPHESTGYPPSSRSSNSPYLPQHIENSRADDHNSLSSGVHNSPIAKSINQNLPGPAHLSPMVSKAQVQPYILPSDHLSRVYTSANHHLTMSPIHVPPLDYLQQPSFNHSQYQGIRVEAHTGYNMENGSSDPGYRDSSVSSHSNDDAASPHSLHKEESNVCATSETTYLQERNEYLENRVKELEGNLINERMMKRRREWLEERVRELEIEKSLLKSLLIERDDCSSRVTKMTPSSFHTRPNSPSKELIKRRRMS
ncbi:hypothetical protein K7432_011225 [Basidiobolus ranarum]|uniref:C2H2-type domain-containing protein n=1 Tax=Basidiobolus ranarum TaxID=34480 RepID=A0ABR2VU79_9FUNG